MDTIDTKVLPTTASTPVLVRLRLIGQMEAWTASSESILPTGRKTRALLAIVALAAPRPVLRGRLAEMLWSRRPEEQARASLRQEIHRLLDALDPLGTQLLAVNRDNLALRPGTVWVDVDEVLRASAAKPATLSLVDGELLEGLDGIDPAFDNWLLGERERLNDRARALADSMLREQTEPAGMIAAAQQLLRIDRTHESAWRAIMRAHVSNGERGMALQAYERCRAVLADQLDAQPSAETQRLAAEIRSEAINPRLVPSDATGGGASSAARLPLRQAMRPAPRPPVRPQVEEVPLTPAAAVGNRPPARMETGWAEPADLGHDGARENGRTPMPRGGARVGVLPLQLMGVPESETHLAIGMADAITAELARSRWMFVVSSNGLGRVAQETRDEHTIRQAFGLDFMLDGIAQRAGNKVRVSFRLLDLRGGNQVVWSDKFDRDADNLLTLQDEVAACVVAQTEPAILMAEAQRVAARPARTPTGYERLMRGLALMSRLDRSMFVEAGEMLRQATNLAPDSANAHSWYAFWHLLVLAQGWAEDETVAAQSAVDFAERAIMLDQNDALALTIAGHMRATVQHRLHEAVTLHERALGLNPNLGLAWALSGVTFTYLGNLAEADRRVANYKRLSPHDPHAFALDSARVAVAMLQRDFDTAIALGREVASLSGAFGLGLHYYVAALGHGGSAGETQGARARLLAAQPDFSISRMMAKYPLSREEDRALLAEGLRRAGIPE